jgi:transposase
LQPQAQHGHKRLEKHHFTWPESRDQVLQLDARQLHWLLEGLDIGHVNGHENLLYETMI